MYLKLELVDKTGQLKEYFLTTNKNNVTLKSGEGAKNWYKFYINSEH